MPCDRDNWDSPWKFDYPEVSSKPDCKIFNFSIISWQKHYWNQIMLNCDDFEITLYNLDLVQILKTLQNG